MRKVLTTQTAVGTILIRISSVFWIVVDAGQDFSVGAGLTANRAELTKRR